MGANKPDRFDLDGSGGGRPNLLGLITATKPPRFDLCTFLLCTKPHWASHGLGSTTRIYNSTADTPVLHCRSDLLASLDHLFFSSTNSLDAALRCSHLVLHRFKYAESIELFEHPGSIKDLELSTTAAFMINLEVIINSGSKRRFGKQMLINP